MVAGPLICQGSSSAVSYTITNPKNAIDFIDGFGNKKVDNPSKFTGRIVREIVEGIVK